MNPHDPNVAKVELIAQALGELREKVVFVGGCAVGLLLTDPAAAPPRVTYDVDLIAEVAPLSAYHRLEGEFSRLGFQRDAENTHRQEAGDGGADHTVGLGHCSSFQMLRDVERRRSGSPKCLSGG